MKKKVFVLAAVFSGLFIGCTGGDPTEPLNGSDSSVLVDGRDGNVYRTVNMAGLKWMAENLRYYNMDKVLGCSLDPSSEESRIPKCYLEDCKSYGYFYANLKNVCPEGWRLPTRDDYARLLAETSAGGYQELFASTGWNAPVSLDGDTILFATSSVMDLFVNGEEEALLFGLSRNGNVLNAEMEFGSDNVDDAFVRCVEGTSIIRKGLPPSEAIAGTFTDTRNGVTYKTVTLKDQVWMAQNLDYDAGEGESFCRNGPRVIGFGGPYVAVYDTCAIGYDYSWSMAQQVCPEGWRVPSVADVEKLINTVGGAIGAAPLLTTGFPNSDDYYNVYDFSAIATDYNVSKYWSLSLAAHFWTSDSLDSEKAYRWTLDWYDASIEPVYSNEYQEVVEYAQSEPEIETKQNYYPVRCMKDL